MRAGNAIYKFYNFTFMVHELKTWEEYFNAIASGEKTFELRKNDRGFLTGDELLLREYNQQSQLYTGRTVRRKISYVLSGNEAEKFGLKPGYCIMGLKEI
jgi:hypothetical protein